MVYIFSILAVNAFDFDVPDRKRLFQNYLGKVSSLPFADPKNKIKSSLSFLKKNFNPFGSIYLIFVLLF